MRKKKNEPILLNESRLDTVNIDPLLGFLRLETSDGAIVLGVNRVVAELLKKEVDGFLSGVGPLN